MRLLGKIAVGVVFASLMFPLASRAAEIRTWTDVTGKHKIEATFERVDGENVVLTSKEGKTVKIPKSRLCEADREACETLAKASGAGSGSVWDVEATIREERTAAAVVALLQEIAADEKSTAELKAYVERKLPEWQMQADAGAIQYGGRWMTADEVKEVQKEAADLMDQSVAMIGIGSHALARESLLKASKVDPEGIQADFTLGMLHALVGGHPEEARGRFQVCLRRLESLGRHRSAIQNANMRAVLNNIALTEVRSNRVTSAIALWEQATSQGNVVPEIVQNIGRLSDVAAAGVFLRVPNPTQKAIGRLYAKAATENSSVSYSPGTGWLYIPYLCDVPIDPDGVGGTDDDRVEPAAARKRGVAGTQKLRVFASGSGFAVSGDLVITNRHVAEGAQAFQLGDGGQGGKSKLSGELVAISEKRDLALLRFPGLGAKPLVLRADVPRLAADVRVLGFPESEFLGNSLKVTAGSVAGLPQPKSKNDLHQMILLDAVANPGNSGGPVIDVEGRVVGALTLGVNLRQAYTAAVPAEEIRAFMAPHLDAGEKLSDPSSAKAATSRQWEDVVEASAGSTYQILVLGASQAAAWVDSKSEPDAPGRPKRPTGWNGLEDPWCMYCNGVGHLPCPVRKCKTGVIVGRKRVSTQTPQGPVYTHIPDPQPCRTCSGSGRVSCPHCSNGFDPRVRSGR